MQSNESLVVPFFRTEAKYLAAQSKKAGRPIYKEVEKVEVRMAGERQYAPVFNAHAMWKRIDGEEITYAMRWPEQYAAFKAQRDQVADGTPLSEAPFLTEARRAELRHNKVYTVEALASVEGKNLSNLGPEGRRMKQEAVAYLERATRGGKEAEMMAEIEALKAQLAAMQVPAEEPPAFDDEIETLKEEYAQLAGSRPRGNPKAETLRAMIADLKG